MISRRILLSGVLASVAGAATGRVLETSPRPLMRDGLSVAPQAWPKDASNLLQAAKLTGGVSFVVMDAQSGQVLEAHDPSLALPPASVAKAITTLYALDKLGASYRFNTRILITGPVVGGIVQGDVVLAGGGDPHLQTDQLAELAARLAAQQVKGVTGRFLYWEGALPQIAEVAKDQPVYVGYNPSISGLNLNFNRVNFEWKKAGKGWQTSVDARGEKFNPPVRMAEVKIAQRDLPVFSYQAAPNKDLWTVASQALGKGGSRWLPVRLPGLYTADVFQTLAQSYGVKLPQGQQVASLPNGQEIAQVQSDELALILKDMLRHSTNLTSECCGLRSSQAQSLPRSAGDMARWVEDRFGVKIHAVDHSGLAGQSRVCAADMAKILWQAQRQNLGLKALMRDTPVRNDKGEAIKNHPVKIAAKSGTLNFVSGLAGYITPPSGRELIFAIFTGDPARRDAVPVDKREKPPGSPEWLQRSRRLQNQLIMRWSDLYA